MRRALLLILASHSYITAWALAATQPLKIRRVFLSPSALNLACNGDVLKTCCRFRDAGVTQVAALASSTDEEAMAQPLLADGAVDSIVSATEESARLPGASDLVVCASIPELAAARRRCALTIWLNPEAAADIEPTSKGFLAEKIIADLADSVCASFEDLPDAMRAVLEIYQGQLEQESDAAISLSLTEVQTDGAVEIVDAPIAAPKPGEDALSSPEPNEEQLSASASAPELGAMHDNVQPVKMHKFCTECGMNLARSAKFCSDCGAKQPHA